MKKLIAVLLCMVVTLLAVRVWQELPVARGGQPNLATENGDVNGDGFRDVKRTWKRMSKSAERMRIVHAIR